MMDEKKKILLADDTKLFLELEKTFLQRSSVEILTANNGREALELARLHRPAIAILDLNMPEMDGDECCRAIRQDPDLQDMAIVMVTTQGRNQDQERCHDAGCDKVLLKPINRTEFLATVKELLQLSTRHQRYQARIQVQCAENGGISLTEFSVDISSGGLFIGTENPFAVGESLVLHFSLEDQTWEIVCKGRVAWINARPNLKKPGLPPGMGVQFVDISLDDLHAIRKFMENNPLVPSW